MQNTGFFELRNRWSGRCLNADSSAGTFPLGARAQLWDCLDHHNGQWQSVGKWDSARLRRRWGRSVQRSAL
ncbi:MAG: hypothetical protein ABW022_17310 [Actinoplanes sp.]